MNARATHTRMSCLIAGAALAAACGSGMVRRDGGAPGGAAGARGGGGSGGNAGGVTTGGAGGSAGPAGGGGTGGAMPARDGGSARDGAPEPPVRSDAAPARDATPGAPDALAGAQCAHPVFMTSDHNGGFSDGGYYVHNNMWNSQVRLGPETLYACSYHDWYVVSNQTNEQGAVKTYPNVHRDYANVPISSFHTLTTTFAATSPHVGIYDVAYDIWTNGVASAGSTEFMIWTENFHQVPAGNRAATVTLGGRTYDVWKTGNNGYIAFVPTTPFTAGTIDLLEIFRWTTSQGWLRANSTLGQLGFGVEIVSTEGKDARFDFTSFSITSS